MDALNILINKNVNVRFLKYCLNKKCGFKRYNQTQSNHNKLTEDEWDFLKSYITERSLSGSLIQK